MNQNAKATSVFEKILCPVDFSDCSAGALRYANALAQCQGASVTVVHADSFSAPAYFRPSQVDQLRAQWERWKAGAKDALEDFVATTVGPQSSVTAVQVVEAAAAQAIPDTVQELKPDLIVMGTHGRTRVKRFLLGSVTEQVLRAVNLPLLAVRVGVSRVEIPARHVLCAVNNSPASKRALNLASLAGRCFNAPLTVLHVRQPKVADDIEDLHAWIGQNQEGLCGVREEVRDGEPATEIVAAALEGEYDLTVVGARHRRFAGAMVLSMTTVRTVRHCLCPVLVVPAGQSANPD